MIASGAFSRHRRGPPGLARRQYPGERGGGMFGVRGAYFAGWITVEIDADRACDKALQIHHTRGVDAQNCAQLAPSENWAAGQDVGGRFQSSAAGAADIFRARMFAETIRRGAPTRLACLPS